MTWHRDNPIGALRLALAGILVLVLATVGSGQQFTTPELPLGKTLDGRTYGDPGFRGTGRQFPDTNAAEGRIIEGRVLTGPNGEIGDMTLRFPQRDSTLVDGAEATAVFGPVEIQPQSRLQSQGSSDTARGNLQTSNNSSGVSARRSDLRELPNREIVRQRYSDGSIHIARHVMQDAEGNWINDGQWKLFDQQGAMIATGSYRDGAMHGKWARLHTAGSGGIFANLPFIEFEGPYASHATFDSGKLSGTWVIKDRRGQKIFEMPYEKGRRNGVAAWYLPQNRIFRRMEFKDDVPVGNLVEYDRQGKIRRKEVYSDGMKIVSNVSYYRPSGQKRLESVVRRGRLELQGEDDWWEARPASMIVTGQDVEHGPIRSWYENGQTKMVGNLVQGVRVGRFVWWHDNGTKQLMGQYDKSGSKTGSWRWWHANGIKSIDGKYTDGQPDGDWRWWNDQGELVNEESFDPQAMAESAISIDLTDDQSDERKGSVDATSKNSEDPFGEDVEEDSVLDSLSLQQQAESKEQAVDTEFLEGIEPESFEAEEIPEPSAPTGGNSVLDDVGEASLNFDGDVNDGSDEGLFEIQELP
jgi:antitoxin component YwqK of YwqJK toxin-antitoxin module